METKFFVLTVFILSYLSFIIFPKMRSYFSVLFALILILKGVVSIEEAFYSINWNVIGIFIGTFFVADLFIESRIPAYFSEIIIKKAPDTKWAILFVCAIAGFFSAFLENVAVVLIVAPVAFSLAEKLRIDPTDMIIGIAISSNLQGCATLIGDPPSMLLAGFDKLNFLDFFFYKGKMSIFFAVEIGAVFSFLVLYFIFKKYKTKIKIELNEKINSFVPAYILIILILLLSFASFFKREFLLSIICLTAGMVSFFSEKFLYKKSYSEIVKKFDWETTLFIISIFILVKSVSKTGWIETFSYYLSGIVGKNLFLGYFSIVLISMFLSGFIDNVPFLVTMLPVASYLAERLNVEPYLFLFGLLIGTSLGGNITPTGASANIVACGLLKQKKYNVNFFKFVKIGLLFTLAAVLTGSLFIWFVWR